MKKKLLALVLSTALVAMAIVGGTFAYLSDVQSDVNVMTMGSVYIKQHEYQRAVNADGTYATKTIDKQTSYVLEDFVQGKPILPIVGDPNEPGNSPAYKGFDDTTVRMTQVGSYGGMQVFAGKNAVDKFVVVENTGKSDAYVRTLVAIEIGNTDGTKIGTSSRAQTPDSTGTQPWIKNSIGTITIDGNNYSVVEYIYRGANDVNRHVNGVLPAGETTYPNLCQVYIKHNATNADCEAIDGNNNGTLDIFVVSQAVQVAGFENATQALDAAFGDVTVNNNPWTDGVKIPVVATDADALVGALENGEDVVMLDDVKIDPAGMSNAYGTTGINVKNGQTVDGTGNVLDIKGAGGTWDSGICVVNGTIKNITVTGSFRGIFVKNNTELVVVDNVIIKGTTYTISCDQGAGGGLLVTNSTLNGWTSFAKTIGDVRFENCNFGEGNGYSFCRPYAPTTFVGCDFEAGYEMDPRAAVTFENCTIGGVALTADNLATLVTSNIANATVK